MDLFWCNLKGLTSTWKKGTNVWRVNIDSTPSGRDEDRETAYGISVMIYETLRTINCENKHSRDKWAKDKKFWSFNFCVTFAEVFRPSAASFPAWIIRNWRQNHATVFLWASRTLVYQNPLNEFPINFFVYYLAVFHSSCGLRVFGCFCCECSSQSDTCVSNHPLDLTLRNQFSK